MIHLYRVRTSFSRFCVITLLLLLLMSPFDIFLHLCESLRDKRKHIYRVPNVYSLMNSYSVVKSI